MIDWTLTITTNAGATTFGWTGHHRRAVPYVDPALLAECRPGGGPHPRLHTAVFRRLAQRTTRRHQRRGR